MADEKSSEKDKEKEFFEKIMKKMGKFLEKVFELNKYDFDELVFEKEVINEIIVYARHNYPNEFMAFLEGKVEKKQLIIHGLYYQPYQASKRATASRIDPTALKNCFGSVHSHPSPNNEPSNADLTFFNKYGIVHLIICKPFSLNNIQAYDLKGNKIGFKII